MATPFPDLARKNLIKYIFEAHYPKGRIDPISLDDIPQQAMGHFERYSSRFIPPQSYKPGQFDASFCIHNDRGNTYVVTQEKIYELKPLSLEKLVYLASIHTDDMMLYSEIRHNVTSKSPYFVDKPFVGISGCSDDNFYDDDVLQKVWVDLGVDQIEMMNALSYAMFGFPLHSDTLICDHEKPLWEELSKRELTKAYFEGDPRNAKIRYMFDDRPVEYKFKRN